MPKKLFKKGTSGNPSGRPKDDQKIAALARTYAEEAIMVLVGIMQGYHDDITHADRCRAAQAILDRGYGKPRQAVDLASDKGGLKIIIESGEAKSNG